MGSAPTSVLSPLAHRLLPRKNSIINSRHHVNFCHILRSEENTALPTQPGSHKENSSGCIGLPVSQCPLGRCACTQQSYKYWDSVQFFQGVVVNTAGTPSTSP